MIIPVMSKVKSSNIAAVGYDKENKKLYVEFKGTKKKYQYDDVKENIYKSFLRAKSKGQYFSAVIKNSYAFKALEEEKKKDKA